jgi:small subunit ribosomal protein S4e
MTAHLKRLAVPRSWNVERKTTAFVMRPLPGGLPREFVMPLQIVMRDILGLAKTGREVKYILSTKEVLVNGVRRKEQKFPLMLMDILEIPAEELSFRMVLDRKGKLAFVPTKKTEAHQKLLRLQGKTSLGKGRIQLNFMDGTNIIVEKDAHKTNDVIVYDVHKKKIVESLPFEKKAHVLLIGGKRMGDVGVIHDISGKTVAVKSQSGETFETLSRYAFVIGKEKPHITLEK